MSSNYIQSIKCNFVAFKFLSNSNIQDLINMMKKGRLLALSALLIFTYTTMNAQKVIKLWETNPPTSNEITEAEKSERNGNWVTNVSSARRGTVC